MNERKKSKGGKPCRAIVVALVALTVSGCGTLGGLFTEGEPTYVLADPMMIPPNVQPPPVGTTIPVLEASGADTGRLYALVDDAALPENAPRIPVASAPAESSGWMTMISGLLAGTPLGPMAPVAGLLLSKLLLTKRGRQHGVTAAKALAKLDVGTALRATAASDGWVHSDTVKPVAPSAKTG